MTSFNPDPVDIAVGRKLRDFRQTAAMSQSALGDALGISFQQIQKYERGKTRISARRLQQISDLYAVPVSDFFQRAVNATTSTDSFDRSNPVVRYLSTAEGLDLNFAYWKLPRRLRQQIIGLAEALN
jgi:transcriptional regulator with XRE-family HTH domain